MALPYSSHPIYAYRKATIIIALIGIFLCLISYTPYTSSAAGSSFFLAASAVFCAADLIFYALKKVEHPDQDPKWPTLQWMVGDAILAVVLQIAFWGCVADISYMYEYHVNVAIAYGILGHLLCSCLHAWCLWKQLMARYKKRWLAERARDPCPQCGYSQPAANQAPVREDGHVSRTMFSHHSSRTATMTPESVASDMEEGLLIGSDYNGYGSIEPDEPTLVQPEEIFVGKGKKAKKAVGASSKRAVQDR